MASSNRRGFLKSGAALAGAAAGGAMARGGTWERRSAADPDWTPVKIIDCPAMPWGAPNERGWRFKFLYDNRHTGDHLVLIDVPIGAPGGKNHYHDFHEWAYWLSGDFTNNEFTSPLQRKGVMQQFREGVFLDRPAYSLHGGEDDRLPSQVGGTCLIMEEGGSTYSVIPGEEGYTEAWRNIDQWTVPRIIDTIADIPWEPVENTEGLLVKRLVDDQKRGFRANLWRLKPGFAYNGQNFGRPYWYEEAWQFVYVLNGDLRVEPRRAPGKPAPAATLGKDFYMELAPRSIVGLPRGVVTAGGAVWLQVTYARGTSIPHVPIAPPRQG